MGVDVEFSAGVGPYVLFACFESARENSQSKHSKD